MPDDFDDVCASTHGYASADYYSMSMLPAGSGTIGFVEQFRHDLPRSTGWGSRGVFGSTAVSLAYQAGRMDCWQHAPGRRDFLSVGALDWAPGGYCLSSCPVEVGDEHWLYFTGASVTHAWYLDTDWNRLDHRVAQLIEKGLGEIGVACFPKFRLFGFEANPEGVLTINLAPVATPVALFLNYKVLSQGSVRVELCDTLGEVLAESLVLTGDSIGEAVVWKDGTTMVKESKQPLHARLHMQSAQV